MLTDRRKEPPAAGPSGKRQMDHRLCVCLTPLHVLICRRIAEIQKVRFAKGVFITSSDNDKQRHYANRMREFCDEVDYQVLPGEGTYRGQKHLAIWKRRVRYRLAFRRLGPVHAVYAPSSNNHYVYVLLSAVAMRELVTFDDGLLNVNPDSPLYRLPTTWKARLFFLMAGVMFWPERIRKRASRHYSIYRTGNICPRVSTIELIDETDAAGVDATRRTRRILLGPAPESGIEAREALLDAARRFDLDCYLPHPRETSPVLPGLETLLTPLVAEDYVLERVRADRGLRVELYGYDSAALMNLARIPRVEVFSLLRRSGKTAALRSLMERCGVEMLG